ncbi:hypothetical protein H4R24_002551 [Coemansia sp. RSA 988]|nr:hypothetical protein H4R24_002551 [Coemansia sp. RSA 988]
MTSNKAGHNIRTDLQDKEPIVIENAAQIQTRHIFNGIVVEKGEDVEAHIHDCNWNPFDELEEVGIFHTRISVTERAYTIVVELPECMVRYIQVQRESRELAVVGKAMARRQWTDAKSEIDNVHEMWRVYWRRFSIPLQCDPRLIHALYGQHSVTIVVPRRIMWIYRLANWMEVRLWRAGISCRIPKTRKSTVQVW